MKNIMRHLAAKKSQSTGRMAEQLCRIALEQAGYAMIEKVETPRIQVKGRFIYTKTCSGDFRAVEPKTGKSVLVECKYRERNLRPSDFQDHQLANLATHQVAGGISLVAHITQNGCILIPLSEAALMMHITDRIFGQ